MIIKNLEEKVKLAKTLAISSFVFAFIAIVAVLMFMSNQIEKANATIYVLNQDGSAMSANATSQVANRELEYKTSVENYHTLFFNIVPDEQQIEYQMQRAMYLIDESGMQQYNNLKEKGYYTQILSSSSVLTVQTDSIRVDKAEKKWYFYGKQKIDRKSTTVIRSLVTEGTFRDVPRSQNNIHGVLLSNWKTVENKDLETREKSQI